MVRGFILYVTVVMLLHIHHIELHQLWYLTIALLCIMIGDKPPKQRQGDKYDKNSTTRRF